MKHPHLFDAILKTAPNEQSRSRSQWIVCLSVVLAALFLYLALRNLNWASFWNTLSNVQYGFLPIVFVWSSVSYFIRALRWRVILLAETPISQMGAFWANMSGYLGNNILPARSGDLVRAVYANRVAGLSLSFALAGGFSERLMDVIVLILLGSASLSVSGIVFGALRRAIQVMAVVAVIGAIFLLFLPVLSPLMKKIIAWIPFLGFGLKEKISLFLEKFLLGLRALFNLRRAASFTAYTALIWLMDGLGVVIMGFILHIPITLAQAFVLLAGLGLSSAIPSTPGYIGVYQFVAVTVLAPFGILKADALAFILISQILGYIIIGFWGLLGLWRFNKDNVV